MDLIREKSAIIQAMLDRSTQDQILNSETDQTMPTARGVHRAETSTPPQAWHYDMRGHAEQCVERYLELAGKTVESLKLVNTPCIDDHMIPPNDMIAKGELSPVAARIVLKAL